MGNLPPGWARMKYEKQRKRSVQNGDVPIIFFYPAITGTDVFIAQETWDEIKATCNYGLSSLWLNRCFLSSWQPQLLNGFQANFGTTPVLEGLKTP